MKHGTSGIWTWRKWASGIAECWGTKLVYTGGFSAWGGLYISWTNSGANALPFEFADTPTFDISVTTDSTSSLGVVAYGGTSAATPVCEATRKDNAGAINLIFEFSVNGRWK